MLNLAWPICLLPERVQNDTCVVGDTIQSYTHLIGTLIVFVGVSASSICNSRLTKKSYFPDSEKCIEGALFSCSMQVIFVWLLQKIIMITKSFSLNNVECLRPRVTTPFEFHTFIPFIILSVIQAFCTQRHNLVLVPLLYILLSFT